MSRLVIYRGDERLAEHDLLREVVGLGRHPENDIVLDDRTLSRFHARIEKREDAYVVIDLGAQNGVHKNGERIEKESALESGDRIELGKYVAVFEQPRPPPRPTKVEKPSGQNGKNGHDVKHGRVPAPVPEPDPIADDLDIDFDDLEAELRDDDDDDLGLGRSADARTRAGNDVDKTGNLSDFDAGVSSVEYVPPKPTFVLLFNGMEVSRHPMTNDGLTVGRSKQCEIVISLLGLSRKHAKVYVTEDGVAVEDLGSQNGTWVNNQRIEGARVLRHGDLLNFYDYGVLFLEDADVEVGFPGAGFNQPPSTDQRSNGLLDDLSARETDLGDAPMSPPRPRQPTPRSPLTDQKDDAPRAGAAVAGRAGIGVAGGSPKTSLAPPPEETELGRARPTVKRNDDDDNGRFNMDELGDGSFLGDEFEDGASKDREPPSKGSAPIGTELIEGIDLSRGAGDEDLEADIAFSNAAADDDFISSSTDGDMGRLADKTSGGFEVQGLGGAWPADEDLERVLAQTHDVALITLDITLKNKPYAQIPLSTAVTRLGGDARCEVSLPKSAGLRPWHCTFLQMGSAVLVSRANRGAFVNVGGRDIDFSTLKNGDVVKVGNVEIKLRWRKG